MATATPEVSLVEYDVVAGNDDGAVFAKRGCWSCFPCIGSDPSSSTAYAYGSAGACWERMRSPESKSNWWKRGWKKLREWSEIVAGPKWKTFIRRFNRGRGGAYKYTKQMSFQYDPSSYALNFDDGKGKLGDEEDLFYRNFSTRYASIPASAKSSMDLGKEGIVFT